MRKTIKALLIAGSLGALCAGLAACSNETVIDEYFKQGNVISVTYDGSGGNIKGSSGVSIVDMFNPSKYTADADGYIHIKLREPTTRPGSSGNIAVDRSGYTLVGWYRNREIVKVDGKAVDNAGNTLLEEDGFYYTVRKGNDGKTIKEEAVPAYTYSDPWDFAKDTVDFKVGDAKHELTLYAGWVPLFSFEYYYKEDNEWTLFGTTPFDYLLAQAVDRDDLTKIKDCVFVPDWSLETGKMEHKFSSAYTFPSVKDKAMTFKAAYSDEACQHKITRENPYRHTGTINFETAAAINPVQKIYVEFDEGSYYRITTAAQFAAINDPDGYYTILSDELDFNCSVDYENGGELPSKTENIHWPSDFLTSSFTGKIEGEGGKSVTFKNIGAQINAKTTTELLYGGLFGAVDKGAVIKNVSFKNVVLDIKSVTSRRGANLGMFAGNIEEGATLEGVTISGELRLWEISVSGGDFKFHLLANGNHSGVGEGNIKLIVCGAKSYVEEGKYRFDSIDPDTVVVDADKNITFSEMKKSATKENQYIVKYGGDSL